MKIFSLKTIIFIIITILVFYSSYWILVSIKFKSQIDAVLNESDSISYDSLKALGFPYRMQVQIKDFIISNKSEYDEFNATSPLIKLDLNPFDFDKLLIRSENIQSKFYIEDFLLKVLLDEMRSTAIIKNGDISAIIIAINKANIELNKFQLSEISKIYLNIQIYKDSNNHIILTAEGSDLVGSKNGRMKAELEGSYTFKKSTVNGNLQLKIMDIKDHKILFNAPIKIRDNLVSFLFIPLIDLNELFFLL